MILHIEDAGIGVYNCRGVSTALLVLPRSTLQAHCKTTLDTSHNKHYIVVATFVHIQLGSHVQQFIATETDFIAGLKSFQPINPIINQFFMTNEVNTILHVLLLLNLIKLCIQQSQFFPATKVSLDANSRLSQSDGFFKSIGSGLCWHLSSRKHL